MSKMITLSNLKRFNEHIHLSGGSGYIKAVQNKIVSYDTSNIYLNTSNCSLYYNSGNRWNTVNQIQLYEKKPRPKNLALRINANLVMYAGLCDPSETNASAIRVRIGDKIYAVEKKSYTIWNGSASVSDGKLLIAPKKYIYCEYPLIMGGDEDIEIYAVCKYNSGEQHTGTKQPYPNMGAPYFALVREGKLPTTARDTTKPAISLREISVTNNNNSTSIGMVREHKILDTSGNNSSSYTTRIFQQSKDISVECDYKWVYSATTKYLDFMSEAAGFTTESIFGQRVSWSSGGDPIPIYIAIGDMLSYSKTREMVISDFYVKVGGETILTFADIISQFS